FIDDDVVAQVKREIGAELTLARAVRWVPGAWYWSYWLNRTMHDAIAATVLLRTAVAVADHGLAEGLARCRDQIAAAPMLLSDTAAGAAARPVPGLLGIPARPGCYLRQLDRWLARGTVLDWSTSSFITQRLAHANAYGQVVHQLVREFLWEAGKAATDARMRSWDCGHLRRWREVVGYSPVRPPGEWDQPPTFGG